MMPEGFKLVEGLNRTLTSEQYHGIPGVYSSSQLKDAFKDIEYFHGKYVTKKIEKEDRIPAFDIGTYFHTAILEPEKITVECAVFEGIRRGEKWVQFQAANAGKAIITATEFETAQALIKSVQRSEIAMNRIKRGEPEVSAFLMLLVKGSDIYAPTFKKRLGKYGWEDCGSVPKTGTIIWVKTRADCKADSFILDLKSTTGNAKNEDEIRKTISNFHYDLSAALYLDVFSAVEDRTITDFIWTFASKDYKNCRSYIASAKSIQVGRAKYRKAILQIADGLESNWAFEDYLVTINPPVWELEIIKNKEEDLL